jgi:branched-chain amino acid aminotransferase
VRGYGIFEVLRTYGEPSLWIARPSRPPGLLRAQIELALPAPLPEIEAIVMETLARNAARDVTIRIIVTGGASSGF